MIDAGANGTAVLQVGGFNGGAAQKFLGGRAHRERPAGASKLRGGIAARRIGNRRLRQDAGDVDGARRGFASAQNAVDVHQATRIS